MEAFFAYPGIRVEHSANLMELLCRAILRSLGRYTNLRFIDWDKINVSTPDYTDASPRLKIFYVNGWDNDYAKYTPTPDIKSMWIVVHIPVRPDGGFTQQWISAGTGMVYSRVYINGQWSVFGAMLGTNTNMGTVRFSKIGVTQDSDGYHMHIYDDGNTWIAKIT